MLEPENITYARLIAWAEGRLPEEASRVIAEQVAEAELLAFAEFAESGVLSSPPPGLREALIDRFEAYARGRRQPVLLKRLAATLTFDSDLRPAAGVRGAGTRAASRHLVYSTEAASVTLNVRSRPGKRLDLAGQVFPNDDSVCDSFNVRLLENDTEVGAVTTGEMGDFAFRSVAPGVYLVLLTSEQVEILIAPVELRP